MDIAELSLRMEANNLESHTGFKKAPHNNFSPRVTRSQINKVRNPLKVNSKPEIKSSPKTRHKKIDEVEEIYLNKKLKVVHKNLETIYEDPIWKRGNRVLLGASKVKRSIYLDREFRVTSKQKSKLRKMKIKRLGKRTKLFKMSDDEFRNKMSKIESYINGNETDMDQENKMELDEDNKEEFNASDESNDNSKDSKELS